MGVLAGSAARVGVSLRLTLFVCVVCATWAPVASAQQVVPTDAAAALKRDLQGDLAALAVRVRSIRDRATHVAGLDDRPALAAALDRIRAADLLIAEQQRALDARLEAEKVAPAIVQRQREATRLYRERLDRIYAAAAPFGDDQATPSALRQAVDDVARELEDVEPDSDRTPLAMTLPYRSLALPQVAPQFGATVTPAYMSAPAPEPASADLAHTIETELAANIRAKAAELARDPIAIYEFVQNDIRTEFYYGAMKSAAETLRQGGGNDTDQASLLIALLRASAIPARYVRGVIALPGPRALSWTGVGSTRRAAEIFTRAGFPFRPIRQGATIGSFEIEHTWIEAYVPYSNYRGVRLGSIGQAWIPLDPSFKAIDVSAGLDLVAAMGFNADALVPEYLSGPQALSPADFYRQTITDYLAEHRPELTFDQVVATFATRAIRTSLLPSTLPYATVSVNEEAAVLPDRLRHHVRFVAEGEGGPSFDVTVAATELAGRRLTLSYVPATVEDQVAVHAFLGLDNTPAYLVKLRPVLKVGGVVKGAGATPVQMGAHHAFTIEIRTPRSSVSLANSIVAGGYYAIGLGSHRAVYDIPASRAPDDTEHAAADRLYGLAVEYLERWNQAEHLLARVLRVTNLRPALSQVMVGGLFRRTLLFGQPQAIEWRGVFVDADLRVAEPVPMGADGGRAREFMRLSGLAGSMLEGEVLQQTLGVDAVSAAKVIQLARAGAIAVQDVDAANIASVLPLIDTADVVKAEIADAVNQGWRVTVPGRDLARNIWTGIGYIVLDPTTGAGGYFISGGLAGGMPTESPEEWVQQQLAQELGSPYQEEPNTDPTAVASLRRVPITDRQSGRVGEPLAKALAVWARDGTGRPVQGVTVTFVVQFGGGAFERETMTVTTGYLGVAEAKLTLGTNTSELPFYVREKPGDANLTQVGQNTVTAFVSTAGDSSVHLDAPFQHFAYPGPPVHLVKVLGDTPDDSIGLPAGTAGGSLLARAEDEFGNPVSNVPVNFAVLPPVPLAAGGINVQIYPPEPPCAVTTPLLGDCGGVDVSTAITSRFGAAVNTILGNTVATTFRVLASVPGSGSVAPQTFTLRSSQDTLVHGRRTPMLMMTRVELVNERGERLNSAPVGMVLRRPVETVLYVQEPDYILERLPPGFPCVDPRQDACYDLRSLETTRIRPVDMNRPGVVTYTPRPGVTVSVDKSSETAAVSFSPAVGGGTTNGATNTPPGRYASTLTVGGFPSLNRVDVTATASVWLPCFDLHLGTVTPKLLTLKAGELVEFLVIPSESLTTCPFPTPTDPPMQVLTHTVFGVRATIPENAVHVTLDGATSETVPLPYVIEPEGFFASTADVDLFQREENGDDKWLGYLPGSQRGGAGLVTLLQGTQFDLTKEHRTQLVLNRGTDVEIPSEKAGLTLIPAALLTRLPDLPKVTTYLDRVNQEVCPATGSLGFALSREARVTILVDGNVLVEGTASGPVRYENVPLAGGGHQVTLTPDMVPLPGEHAFTITAVFEEPGEPEVTHTVSGIPGCGTPVCRPIVHDVVINAFLAVGHTIIKNVDLQDGHIAISRQDLSIPGHGPSLEFTRGYGSSGSDESGPMGAGWRHNYDSRIVKDPCGAITVVGGEGSGIRFSRPTDEPNQVVQYKPQVGYHGRLEYHSTADAYEFYMKDGTHHHYERAFSRNEVVRHRLSFIEDTHGNRLTLTYDTQAPFNLKTVTDPSGRRLTFSYKPFGVVLTLSYKPLGVVSEDRIVQIDGPLGLKVMFDYDAFGNLTRATRDVSTETYEYTITQPGDRHNLLKIFGPNHGATGSDSDVTSITYYSDQDGFPGESTNLLSFPQKYEFVKTYTEGFGTPEAATHQFSYDYSQLQTKLVTTVRDPRLVSTLYTMNPIWGAVVEERVQLPEGDDVTTTQWAFDDPNPDVQPTAVRDSGRVTRWVYDSNGNLVTETIEVTGFGYAPVTNANGAPVSTVTTLFEYEPTFNRVTRKVDPEGNVTTYDIDPATGEMRTETTDPADGTGLIVRKYSYGTAGTLKGLVRSMSDPSGFVTKFEEFDDFGHPKKVLDPAGNVTTNVYDARSRLLEMRDTFGHHTVYEAYDGLDRATRVTMRASTQPVDATMFSEDRTTVTDYLPGGQRKSVTNGLGHVTTYQYDALNRLRTETDILVAGEESATLVARTVYDGNGNILEEIDRRGLTHQMRYDELNRLREVRVGGQLTATYSYDAVGNRLTESDVHGHVTAYEYDGLYRKVKTILPLQPHVLTAAYDQVGNVLRTTDANGHATTRTNDGVYRLKTETSDGVTMQYEYDLAGNVLREENLTSGLVVRSSGYDGLNRPATVVAQFTDPLTGQVVSHTSAYHYDDARHAKDLTNARGITIRQRSNGHDVVIEEITDAGVGGLNLRTAYKYDGNGNLAALKDAAGSSPDVIHTYDGLNRKITTTYPLNDNGTSFYTERFAYDGNGNVTRAVDKRGIVKRFEYDHLNRKLKEVLVESITNGRAELLLSSTRYDDPANVSEMIDETRGGVFRHELDGLHREIRQTDPLGHVMRLEWDGVNKVAAIDKRGLRSEFGYDARNRLVETREFGEDGVLLSTTSTRYLDAQNRRIDIARRAPSAAPSLEVITQFDALERVRRVSQHHPSLASAYGATELVASEHAYDEGGNEVATLDANGNRTEFVYDAADRRIQIKEAAGSPDEAITTYTYDGAGNALTVKDGRDHGVKFDRRFTFDLQKRRVSEENATHELTRFVYDGNANLVDQIEPKGQLTHSEYDELNQLISVQQGDGGVTRYRYDPSRNKVSQLDASGNLFTFRFDLLNRLTDTFEHVTAGGDESTARHWHYEYDGNDNQKVIVDAEQQRVEKTYDYLDRIVRKQYANHKRAADGTDVFPKLLNVVYQYDPNGNATRVVETKELSAGAPVVESSTMAYDILNRVTEDTNADGKAVRHQYDRQGNRRALTDADSVRTDYTFDARNRIATVTTESGSSQGTTTYSYWLDSQQRTIRYPNGAVAEFEYDAADRLTRVLNHNGTATDPISQYAYRYDANGSRTSQVERHRRLGTTPEETTYQYDASNRISSVHYPSGAVSYTYAPNGNRLSEVGVDPITSGPINRQYAYDGVNQLATIRDAANPNAGVVFSYDRNGNRLQQKVGAVDPATGQIPAPVQVRSYDYDIRDNLLGADRVEGGRVTFDYDYARRRVKMTGPSSNIRFVYDHDALLQEYDATSLLTTQKYNYASARLLSLVTVTGMQRNSFFYLFDGLGSTSELTGPSADIKASYKYDIWGGIRQSHDDTPNRRKFTGHYTDTETGLQYFGARYYDAGIGRFVTADSYAGDIRNPVTLNRFLYANANPLAFVDPTGHASASTVKCNEDKLGSCTGASLILFVKGAAETLGEPLFWLYDFGQMGLYVGREISRDTGADTLDDVQFRSALGRHAAGTFGDDPGCAWCSQEMNLLNDMAVGAVRAPYDIPKEVGAAILSGDPERMGAAFANFEQMLAGGGKKRGGKTAPGKGVVLEGGAPGPKPKRWDRRAKAALEERLPVNPMDRRQRGEYQATAAAKNVVIGVRPVDIITKGVITVLEKLGFPPKPASVQAKSRFGFVYENGKMYRADVDLAYVRDRATGEIWSNRRVWREIILPTNRRLRGAGTATSVTHPTHLTAFKFAGEGPLKTWSDYAKIGDPGGAIEIGALGSRTLTRARVRALGARHGRWHPAWDAGPAAPGLGPEITPDVAWLFKSPQNPSTIDDKDK